jgi:hypothetical protein
MPAAPKPAINIFLYRWYKPVRNKQYERNLLLTSSAHFHYCALLLYAAVAAADVR